MPGEGSGHLEVFHSIQPKMRSSGWPQQAVGIQRRAWRRPPSSRRQWLPRDRQHIQGTPGSPAPVATRRQRTQTRT